MKDLAPVSNQTRIKGRTLLTALGLLAASLPSVAQADADAAARPRPPTVPAAITYTNIAAGNGAGIAYRRQASTTNAAFDALKLLPYYARPEIVATPFKARGAPGVVMFDYDRDGDLDLYVTNGPGRANALYQNQLKQTGQTTFVDRGAAAGLELTSADSTGVCYGDIDNDGDLDLMVLGRMEPDHLFKNNGDGTFSEITTSAGVGGGSRAHTSCAMGDINGDGKLDIAVSNTFDWARQDAIFTQPFSFGQQNELYLNQGNNVFANVSQSSGIQQMQNVPPGDGTTSWAITLVDIDQDGDLDILQADDQAAYLPSAFAGIDRGILHVFKNDGTGHFVDVAAPSGLATLSASWMGFSYGDINCDGHLDFFSTSVGDYIVPEQGGSVPLGVQTSRWFTGSATGLFTPAAYPTQPIPGIVSTPHGWGTGMFDYDNDGDVDILYTGGMDAGPFVQVDNPGVVLSNNGCTGAFTFDAGAFASSRPEIIRSEINTQAMGDLNDDGFVDVVHVAGAYVPTTIPLVPFHQKWGGPFDDHAFFAATFFPIGPQEYEWAGKNLEDGRMGVQINSAGNGNKWVKITTRGSVGTLPNGKVNRDGIGAIIRFTPDKGKTSMSPVLGGSSHAGQDDLTRMFGLGTAKEGDVEVLWPGGARNKLYDVDAGERLTLPEIPCSYAGTWPSKNAYRACVDQALASLQSASVITLPFSKRLKDSAYKAYDQAH